MEHGLLPSSEEFGVRALPAATLAQLTDGSDVPVIDRARPSRLAPARAPLPRAERCPTRPDSTTGPPLEPRVAGYALALSQQRACASAYAPGLHPRLRASCIRLRPPLSADALRASAYAAGPVAEPRASAYAPPSAPTLATRSAGAHGFPASPELAAPRKATQPEMPAQAGHA
jgi:hypothetical protein